MIIENINFLVNWDYFSQLGKKLVPRNRTRFCIEKKPRNMLPLKIAVQVGRERLLVVRI